MTHSDSTDVPFISFIEKERDYYKAGAQHRIPRWIPLLINVLNECRGDGPFSNRIVATGTHNAICNRYGAVSVLGSDGHYLGIRLTEFDVVEFVENPDWQGTR